MDGEAVASGVEHNAIKRTASVHALIRDLVATMILKSREMELWFMVCLWEWKMKNNQSEGSFGGLNKYSAGRTYTTDRTSTIIPLSRFHPSISRCKIWFSSVTFYMRLSCDTDQLKQHCNRYNLRDAWLAILIRIHRSRLPCSDGVTYSILVRQIKE